MARNRIILRLVVAVFLAAFAAAGPASAQWSHGSYSVKNVPTKRGNYTYSGGSNSGYVEALFPSGTDPDSAITVEFQVTWTYPGPPQATNLYYQGDLTWTAGSGSSASASITSNPCSVSRDTTNNGNPGSGSYSGGTAINSNNYVASITGGATVTKGTGSSGDATSTVSTHM